MSEPVAASSSPSSRRSPTVRDFAAVIFRHRKLALISFLTIFLGMVLVVSFMPEQYSSGMKILVKRERVESILALGPNPQAQMAPEVTQEDLNSEVELLKSKDLLEKVVLKCGLHEQRRESVLRRLLNLLPERARSGRTGESRVPLAVIALERSLEAEPITKSKVIEVRYTAYNPDLAAKVLQTLSNLYLEKHLAVHRPSGALDFFQHQTDRYRKELEAAEQQLMQFAKNQDVISADLEKDITVRKLSEFEAKLRETRAQEAAVEQRIRSLQAQAVETPKRVTTQVRTSDNPYLLQQMKTTLLTLELKRTELLSKYEPGYRPVKDLEAQIAQAREALEQAEKRYLRDETTDLDRTHAWIQEELARAHAELATLRASSVEIAGSVRKYREEAREVGRKGITQQDLARAAKTSEENYLLYQRKQEEARISAALDRERIINVALAEAPTVPAVPSGPNWLLTLSLGLVLAIISSLGLVFIADHLDSSIRTPDEVEGILGVPLLAAPSRNS